jgi:hypothetical protein
MLLGYIVSQKVAALERMGPIRDLKGVQKVLGCLAALSRFISRLGEKGLPLYRSPTPEPLGTRVISREIRAAAFPQRFPQPTTIVKYNGETDPRVWLNDYRLAC